MYAQFLITRVDTAASKINPVVRDAKYWACMEHIRSMLPISSKRRWSSDEMGAMLLGNSVGKALGNILNYRPIVFRPKNL